MCWKANARGCNSAAVERAPLLFSWYLCHPWHEFNNNQWIIVALFGAVCPMGLLVTAIALAARVVTPGTVSDSTANHACLSHRPNAFTVALTLDY